jgi:hypothetical protein
MRYDFCVVGGGTRSRRGLADRARYCSARSARGGVEARMGGGFCCNSVRGNISMLDCSILSFRIVTLKESRHPGSETM